MGSRCCLAAVLLSSAAAVPAAARADEPQEAEPETGERTPMREVDLQQHEVRVDVDLSFESEANGALFDAQYTFTPGGIDRNDVVVPNLRRFVRRPSAVWARVYRNGHTRESMTGGGLGGILNLGPAYATGEVGVELDVVSYDPDEHGFWDLPFTVEVGARPIELLSVGAFYTARPIFADHLDPELRVQATRTGNDARVGGRVAYATDTDRFYLSVAGWGRITDWSYIDLHPGDLTIRGIGGSARAAIQLTPTFTLVLRTEVRREHWDNTRINDLDVSEPTARDVWFANGGVEVLYWFKGRYAFRFGIGGGYEGKPPTVNSRATGIEQMDLGVITRF